MSRLRDGSETQDRRLDRLVHYDARSRDYPIRELLDRRQITAPRSYTWACQTVLDQGAEGACVGYGCTHELIARPKTVVKDATFAREDIYWEAQRRDPWPGGAYPGAEPQYEGTAVLFGVQMLHDLGYVSEYRWAFGLQDLALAVGWRGPAILGVPWFEGMFDVDSTGFINVRGEKAGGHCILVNGVDAARRSFTLTNSWGTGWGRAGRCRISWSDMEKLLHDNGEACIPLVRSLPERAVRRIVGGVRDRAKRR